MTLDLTGRRRAGIIVGVSPTTGIPAARLEIRHSTQSSTASTNWTTIVTDPTSAGYRQFVELPYSTRLRYLQARHILLGYTASSWSTMLAAKPRYLPDALREPVRGDWTRISDGLNLQGSLLTFVSPLAGTFFSYTSGGPGAAQMWISFGWTTQSLYRPDGSTVTVPGVPAAPSAPSTTTVAGGALGARTRYVKVAYLKTDPITGHETLYPVSAESSQAIAANFLLKVTALTDPGNNLYSGWAVLVGSTTGNNYVQGTVAKQTFGVDWTEPVGGFSTTQNSLWTASWNSLTKIGLDPTTTYKHYPYYDIAKNFVYIPAETTNPNSQLASLQNGDGVLTLGRYGTSEGYSGVVSIATPAGASTGSGTAGGGRLT